MRLDRVQVAVRPRNILECLDLALLVCGRRPLGIVAAAAIGAVPMILLNRVMFGATESEVSLPAIGLATALEMPWAVAPLTLYLGQAMFAERFTAASWRHCLRAFAGAVWPLLLFQCVVRGLAFITFFGALVWLPLAYYFGPVTLLERGRTGGILGRCGSLCRCELARIMLLLVIDAVLLALGWVVAYQFLGSFTALWRGGALRDVLGAAFDPFAEDGDAMIAAVQAFASWPSQIAFWAAATLVTVYRFFTYLDTRIRHEGWDIELKFRAPRTYAGLTALRAAAGAILVAACLGGTATVAAPAETVAAVEADAARDAVAKQNFPWYDAAADAYRPMVRAVPEEAARPITRELGLGAIARGVMIALLAILVAGAIWLLVRYGLDRRGAAGRERAPAETVLGADALEALPEAARRHGGDWLAEAERLAAAGDYAAAMVFFHGWQLVQLHGRGVIELARGKTNGRYAAEVAAAAPALHGLFRRSNRLFEDALFGNLPVAAADFAAVWERRDEFRPAPAAEAAA